MREAMRHIAVEDAGVLGSHSWYSSALERLVTVTTSQLAGLVERDLLTAYRGGTSHRLTPDGLAYAVAERFIDQRRADELERLLRPRADEATGPAPELLTIPSCPAGATQLTGSTRDGESIVWDWSHKDRLWHCASTGGRADYVEVLTGYEPLEVTGWEAGHGPAKTLRDALMEPIDHLQVTRGGIRFPMAERVAAELEAEEASPMAPRDSMGRPVHPGYVVTWGDRPERWIVTSWGRYNGGEEGWEWMLRLERERRSAADREGLQRVHALAHACRVVERDVDAPEGRNTDELLHRLRELVSTQLQLAAELVGEDGPEWARVFDELDYRMSAYGDYPMPGAWKEHR